MLIHQLLLTFHYSSLDAHTTADVDYRWKGGKSQGVEIVSKEMAQFEFVGAKTSTKANTNSKGKIGKAKYFAKYRWTMKIIHMKINILVFTMKLSILILAVIFFVQRPEANPMYYIPFLFKLEMHLKNVETTP